MTFDQLLAALAGHALQLRRDGDELILQGNKERLDAAFVAQVRRYKAALLALLEREGGQWPRPQEGDAQRLALAKLAPEQLARVVQTVAGGYANLQDAYPLAPLQEGILFHHLMAGAGDPYLLASACRFASRERLDAYLMALQAVVDRHDILRTAVLWEGLDVPLQVVWRHAPLALEEVAVDADGGAAAAQLYARFHPSHFRIDLTRAPMLRLFVAREGTCGGWVLLQLLHHMAGDHTTIDLMQEEIRMHLLGRQAELPPPYPFRQHVAHTLSRANRDEDERFFRAMLAEVDEPTLPFGLADTQRAVDAARKHRMELEPALAARIRAQARALGVSAASLCHLAWALVLGRLTGRDDVVFGTVMFGRLQGGVGIDRALGLFMNTLPLRVRIDQRETAAAVRGVHSMLAELMVHEHASLALAQQCSGVAAATPLFSAVFNYRHSQSAKPSAQVLLALEGMQGLFVEERSNYPVLLSVDDSGDGFSVSAQVVAPVDPVQLCELMHVALTQLTGALEHAPALPLAQIDVLPAAQAQCVLHDWNASETAFPGDLCCHQLFEAQAARTPDAVALRHRHVTLSYGELNRRANRLARHLAALGARDEALVALCLERGPDMLVALLAVMKAGAAYVPLDAAHPTERLKAMLADCRPRLLLAPAASAARLAADCAVLDPGMAAPPWQGLDEANLAPPAGGARQLAYVIYTSGSTGVPKGVMIEHRALVNLLCSMRAVVAMDEQDRLLAVTTLAFDIAGLELYLPLVSGATLVLLDSAQAQDPLQLGAAIADCGATVMQATPATWRMLLDAGWGGAPRLKALCGGEALSAELAQRLLAHVGQLWNVYGPTETTIWSSFEPVTLDQLAEAAHVAIGRPLANTRLYVLDAHGRPAPAGVPGHLYIGGSGLARGYLNRPHLDAERFLPDPHGHGPQARIYHTGDLGKWLADGRIAFLGRSDHQVKIRGYRVEIGEVEAALRSAPGVADAVVVATPDSSGHSRLQAYVVPRPAATEAPPLRLGVFYFAEGKSAQEEGKYRLYVEGARLADELGFNALWTPERHFTELGSAYPNPSVLSAALAMVTKQIELRSGSVVLPLHDPLRVAEEWSVVDNLSNGRVGVSFASGWVPNDFVFAPHAFGERHQKMMESLDQVRRLWRGEAIPRENGVGQCVPTRMLPRPLQAELPVWLTAAHSPETFEAAGRLGVNVLTALLGQNLAELADKVARYRAARLAHGHAGPGIVSVMLHTYVADTDAAALEAVRAPLSDYLRQHAQLRMQILKEQNIPLPADTPSMEALIPVALQRYIASAALIGSPQSCVRMLERVRAAGCDEVACLIDFGLATDTVLAGLAPLKALEALLAERARSALDTGPVKEHLRRLLPEYMVPASVRALTKLPLTPNGKLDRQALPAPEQEGDDSPSYVAPQGAQEQAIADLWQQLLGVERVGRHAHFFELGGHSILAIQMMSRLRQVLSIEMPLATLFEQPRLADFALAAGAARQASMGQIAPAERGGPLPLSLAQQRLWFLDQLDHAASVAYHMPTALRLRGQLDRQALSAALDRLVARHESLRTRFIYDGAMPVQLIDPPGGCMLAGIDLSAVGGAEQEYAVRQHAIDEASAPFDLAAGPLVRARLLRLGTDEHVLLLTQHHIISDGWSVGILVSELGQLYAAFSQGKPDPLPALPLQYADYAAWQRQWLAAADLQRQTLFWQRTLAGAPPLLPLPTDRPRPAVQSYAGAAVEFALPAALSDALRALSRRSGTTLFMTLLAGWSILMGRLSGNDDVVIGTPVANRQRSEVERLIGFFVNTLALRVDVAGHLSVAQLLAQVKARTLEAYGHQDVPFEQVVDAINPPRSLGHSPLFQVMLVMNPPDSAPLQLPGLALSSVEREHYSAHYDLTLVISDADSAIRGKLEYARDLFDQATARRFISYFEAIMSGIAADPQAPLEALRLLGEAERRQLLAHSHGADTGVAPTRLLHALFEQQAAARPHALAIDAEHESMSYAQLNRRANQLAHHLRTHGIGRSRRVAICLERGTELVVAVLAVLKAGGAYVPLDPAYPAERLAFMLDDSAPCAILTTRALHARLALPPDMPAWLLDAADPPWHSAPATDHVDAQDDARADDPAYIIYTSGSTGQPKGTINRHGGLCNLALAQRISLDIDHHSRILQFASFSFDASVFEMAMALAHGACLCLAPQAALQPGQPLRDTLARLQITHVTLPPSVAALVPDVVGLGAISLIAAGETCPPDLVMHWRSAKQVFNAYGPTEATVWSTLYRCDPSRIGASIPVGRPIANVHVYVLDRRLQPVPTGVAGELYIGGAGVALGYLHRPELNAERFLPDPFSAVPAARMYKTGDLGRWLADGNIEFLGRSDSQVKLRGFRVELGEIEACLRTHAQVVAAAVLVRQDQAGAARLLAYYSGPCAVNPGDLRAHVAHSLPGHMVPAAFVWIDALPRTPNGKLDHAALPAPTAAALASRSYEAPRDAREAAVAAVWQELLHVTQAGRDDHFFELGGHSLLAVQVKSRLQSALGMEIRLGDLFEYPVLADLAAALGAGAAADYRPLTPAPAPARAALSFAQQRLWFLSRIDGASEAYNMQAGVRLRGELNKPALQRALQAIVQRHEALRTTFACTDGSVLQRFATAADCRLPLLESDLQEQADDHGALLRLAQQEASVRFDLEAGPLLRARLAVLGEDHHALLVTMHHIVSDGWSMGVFFKELSLLYQAELAGEAAALAQLPIQYADYAAWQRLALADGAMQQQADYWRDALAAAPPLLALPTDRARPVEQDFAGAFLPFELDVDLTRRLRRLSHQHGTTLYMTLLTGWAILLARLAGQDQVVIGTPVANRGRAEIEGLIGLFVNTLALRIDIAGAPTVGAMLARVKACTLAAQQHQDIPFDQVVEILNPPRSLSHSPLFQAMFVWQHGADRAPAIPGLTLEALDSGTHGRTKFDLTLSLREEGEHIVGGIEYATALFNESTVSGHLRCLRTLLTAMVSAGPLAVERLPLLDAAQRSQFVARWNASCAMVETGFMHAQFELWASRTPAAIAVAEPGRSLSYAQLNAAANRLAHYLRGRGVGPDMRVAICLEHGIEMVVALLAVLKAGAAYVPLDPALPDERLQRMLADCVPACVLAAGAALGRLASALPLIDIGAPMPPWAALPPTEPDRAAIGLRPQHLAYVIYTSGSTGEPKGVALTHANLAHSMEARWATYGRTPARMLQLVSYSFDASVAALWWGLAGGGSVYHPGSAALRDTRLIVRQIQEHGLTHTLCTASFYSLILEQARSTGGLASLKVAVIGGESCPAELPRLHRQVAGQALLYSEYGPTEATIWSTVHCYSGDGDDTAASMLGMPIAATPICVLDPDGEPVPDGCTGEICIGGAGVARGYLHQPELTAARFIADPFMREAGHRLYRSGDLGARLADGRFVFRGRADEQVKLRGYRVELGDVQACLAMCDGVRSAAVVVREDEPGRAMLVAYVTAAEQLDTRLVHEQLAAHLPIYMLPAAIVPMAALPLGANGKLDRTRLPAPPAAAAGKGGAAPHGELERSIASAWAYLLKRETIARDDNFFDLGGHSLLTLRLASMLRQLGIELDVTEVFSYPTVAALAEHVRHSARRPSGESAIAIRTDGEGRPLFLIHDGEGQLLYAPVLVAALDSGFPVYGLPPLREGETQPTCMQEMAARMVRMMRAVQAEGPYRVAGWSFGGIVAHAVGAHLLAHGESVEFLGVIDSYRTVADAGERAQRDACALLRQLVEREGAGEAALRRELAAATAEMAWAPLVQYCQAHGLLPDNLASLSADGLARRIAFRQADLGYQTQALPVALDFFAARDNGGHQPLPTWAGALAEPGRMTVRTVPGSHQSMYEVPHLAVLAQALSTALEEAAMAAREKESTAL